MPHLDQRSGEIVIRIVYDGSPEAGKTTNVQSLASTISLQRRGALESPGSTGRRTEFFDWLDFSGGFLDGRRVRCQLVTVPGQPNILHRRRYLLESADVVVYVADSRAEFVDEIVRNLSTTNRILKSRDAERPATMLIQANKQDLPNALSPEALARALGTPPSTQVIGAIASRGDGVMQTFILAARLATDRVRNMLLADAMPDLSLQHQSPAALHAAMTTQEPSEPIETEEPMSTPIADRDPSEVPAADHSGVAEASEIVSCDTQSDEADARPTDRLPPPASVSPAAPGPDSFTSSPDQPSAAPVVTDERHPAQAEHPPSEGPTVAEERHPAQAEHPPSEGPTVAEERHPAQADQSPSASLLADAEAWSLPSNLDVSAGHVWPPVRGRANLTCIPTEHFERAPEVVPWAPPDAYELRTTHQWTLHSTARWLFETEFEARAHLLRLVKSQLRWERWLPEGRTLFLTVESDRWRAWMLTQQRLSLRERFIAAISEHDAAAVRDLWEAAGRASELWKDQDAAEVGPGVIGGADGVALENGKLILLSLYEDGDAPRVEPRCPRKDLSAIVQEMLDEQTVSKGWLAAQDIPVDDA